MPNFRLFSGPRWYSVTAKNEIEARGIVARHAAREAADPDRFACRTDFSMPAHPGFIVADDGTTIRIEGDPE